MKKTNSPWVNRLSLGSDADLAERVHNIPPAFEGLDSHSPDAAAELLEGVLEKIYIASSQDLGAIRKVFSIGSAHATVWHTDVRRHLQTLYGMPNEKVSEPTTIMVTSLAGYGKSMLAQTCMRLLGEPSMTELPEHGAARLVGGICVPLVTKRVDTLNAIALSLGETHVFTSSNDKEVRKARQMLRRAGVCFILVDEAQFLTASTDANAQLAKALNFLRQFDVPLFFIGNYSLGWRLLKRPSEERQRLLTDPIVLVPDGPEDEGWRELLRAYKQVCGEALDIDPISDASQIHLWTAGIRRFLRHLVKEACRKARARAIQQRERTVITLADLRAAYASPALSINRSDVERIRKIDLGDPSVSSDLRCPFPQEECVAQSRREAEHKAYQEELALARLAAEMTASETAAAVRLRDEFGFDTPVPLKPAVKHTTRRSPKPTVASLLGGLAAVRAMKNN